MVPRSFVRSTSPVLSSPSAFWWELSFSCLVSWLTDKQFRERNVRVKPFLVNLLPCCFDNFSTILLWCTAANAARSRSVESHCNGNIIGQSFLRNMYHHLKLGCSGSLDVPGDSALFRWDAFAFVFLNRFSIDVNFDCKSWVCTVYTHGDWS